MNPTDAKARLSPAFWRLWTASTISNLGDGVLVVALPLLASRLTRSELSIAFIGVAAALPWLLFSLPVGAFVDRINHRLLMVRADVFRAIVVGALTIAVASDNAQMWMLWVAAACLGVAEVFFDNASQAMVPSLVPVELLEKANGRRFAAEIAANGFVGTPIGGLLFVAAMWLPFGFDAVTFAVAALLVSSIHIAATPRPATPREHRPLSSDIADGLRWLSGHKVLRGLAIAASLSVLGMQMTAAIFVLFAQDLLDLSDRWYGLLIAIGAIGAVAGGLVAERLSKRLGSLRIIYGTVIVWILCMFAEGFWPRLWVSAIATMAMAFGTTVWNTVTVSLRQRIVPVNLFGRVNSVYRWLVWGSISIGSAFGGLVAREFGLRAPFFIGAAFGLVALITLFFSITPQSLAALGGTQATADDTPVETDTGLYPWPE
ncbi:MAG TPA: MFS transporter [Ilumatobacteraceae bacterium]|nr:MFS transporter [Ilumatobacteraceae bacterium]